MLEFKTRIDSNWTDQVDPSVFVTVYLCGKCVINILW